MHGELIVDRAGFQARDRHERLEGGSRRVLRLNGAIQQRMVRIIGDFPPVGRLDAHREFVGIERGPADHRQHFAGARIHGHYRAVLAFHGQFGDGLQVQIERELQVFPGNGFLVGQYLAGLAAIIHHHLPLAVHAHQRVVVLALDAELADHVALTVFREVGRIQFLLADFTRVADHVRGEAVLRVEAPLRVDQFHLRKEIAVRFDKGQLGGRKFLFDDDGIVLGPRSIALYARAAGRRNPDSIRRRWCAGVRSSDFRAPG